MKGGMRTMEIKKALIMHYKITLLCIFALNFGISMNNKLLNNISLVPLVSEIYIHKINTYNIMLGGGSNDKCLYKM